MKTKMRFEDYTPYTPPGIAKVEAMTNGLLDNFERMAHSTGKIDWERVEINREFLVRVVEYVDRERVYYWVFYGIKIDDIMEAALYCHWILKLKPFVLPGYRKDRDINVCIAFSYFFGALHVMGKKLGLPFTPDANTAKNVYHSFRHHNLSKESLVATAQTIFSALSYAKDIKGISK